MKKNIIILLLLSIQTIFGQSFEPIKLKLEFPYNSGDTIYLDEHPYFNVTNKYFLGWHWERGKAMTKALKMNQAMPNVWSTNSPEYYYEADSCNLIIRSNIQGKLPIYSRAWHYKPTLQMDELHDYDASFLNSVDGIFGFKTVFTNPLTRNRMSLLTNMTPFPNDSIVLKDQIFSDKYIHLKEGNFKGNDTFGYNYDSIPNQYKTVNGEELFISLNLSRLNFNDRDYTGDTILALRLRFVNLPNSSNQRYTGYVKFEEYSQDTNSFISLPKGRGYVKPMVNANYNTTFYITRRMLRRGNETDKHVTLSAKMLFNDQYSDVNNYFLKGMGGIPNNLLIDSLQIELKYYKKNDIGIKWVRIETKPAQDMYRGYWDDNLKAEWNMT